MQKKSLVYFILIQSIIVIVLLLFLELAAYFALKKESQQHPYLLNTEQYDRKKLQDLKNFGFFLVDPLLGWGITEERIKSRGFFFKQNCVLLKSKTNCPRAIKIYISGGSTSDIILNANNWPEYLARLMNQHQLCFEIYVAAVGGYSSGQELLKFIRDGNQIRPDLVISYSGANEYLSPKYVSRHEQHFFTQSFNGKLPPYVLPNIFSWVMKNLIVNPNENLELYFETKKNPGVFWTDNMNFYHALSTSLNADFIGVLQPVLGFSGQKDLMIDTKYKKFTEGYALFYPSLKSEITSKNYLYDFTEIFAHESKNVFTDDCHLNDEYQNEVANNIWKMIHPLVAKKAEKTI